MSTPPVVVVEVRVNLSYPCFLLLRGILAEPLSAALPLPSNV